ncbi:olfactory receptor 10AG1-like [Tachyglossus aculeatus]|uniref:olfactory receptor 10AG1-like n=1 Tax=Tachyglossus aculeatus TaxID=9261 RepID=UPI0018F7C544|nr:olfactory receptor 10AG1-like [Tachyglossus aculeatus]
MELGNLTVEEFVLGFLDLPKLREFLFGIFLFSYMIILAGNGLIIIITTDQTLHTPMYFFLRNLNFLEICYTSVTLPRMLMSLQAQDGSFSFLLCAAQMCFLLILRVTGCFLLAVVAYDLYVAICNPLWYPIIMSHKVCVLLVAGSWISGILVQIGQTGQIFSLPFCDSNKLNHFFCDVPPVLKLVCGDTSMNQLSVYVVALLFVTAPFPLILISYIKIISTILKLPSATGRCNGFSTCCSHLILPTSFFGSGIIPYLRPKSRHSMGMGKFQSLFYTTGTPVFNPMMYSLRNREVIVALIKFLSQRFIRVNMSKNGISAVSADYFTCKGGQISKIFPNKLLTYNVTMLIVTVPFLLILMFSIKNHLPFQKLSLDYGKAQSLLYLLFPPHCHHLVLWICYPHAFSGQVKPLRRCGQTCCPSTPMFNPLKPSLKKQEVTTALKKSCKT